MFPTLERFHRQPVCSGQDQDKVNLYLINVLSESLEGGIPHLMYKVTSKLINETLSIITALVKKRFYLKIR